MKLNSASLLALAACTLLASTAAYAQQGPSGIVLGAAGGASKYNDSCEGVTTCETMDKAMRFNVGYGLGNGLVVEAVSFNFGKLSGSDPGFFTAEIETTAVGGGIAWYASSGGGSSLFVRVGMASVKAKSKVTVSLFGGSFTETESVTQTSPYAGLGWALNLGQNMAIEAAWETTQFKIADTKESVSALTLGLSLRF